MLKIIITAGEPAGIGPDIVVMLAQRHVTAQLVTITDRDMLQQRARDLGLPLLLHDYDMDQRPDLHVPGTLHVIHNPLRDELLPGDARPGNAPHIIDCIKTAVQCCLDRDFDALVTAPVNKAVIASAGFEFSGHTEYIAGLCGVKDPVMLLVNEFCRVALVTTHLPLHRVAEAVTTDRIERVIKVVHTDLAARFALSRPRILVCGLNPHAGEDGYLGTEEVRVIAPVISRLAAQGLDVRGPVPADTAFTTLSLADTDVVLCMYHDQGLPVIKSHGFGDTVNVTLGIPIVRTSVDHGTALELAATGRANPESLVAAVNLAIKLCRDNPA